MNEQTLLLDYLKHYSSLPEFQNMEIQQVIEELEEAVAKDEKASLTAHRRTGSFNSGKHDVYAVVNHACPKWILDLYTQSLQKLTYFCVIDNPWPVDLEPKDPRGSQAS